MTNYELYADASKDRLHPMYESSTGTLKELYRWFGPSPQRAPLHLRINNRELMIKQHLNILDQNSDKRSTKESRGQLKNCILKFNSKYKF